MTYSHVEQRSMKEIRKIVAADQARFDRLAEAWGDLTEDEQKELVHRAEAMAKENS